jgi:hypothetical protein
MGFFPEISIIRGKKKALAKAGCFERHILKNI